MQPDPQLDRERFFHPAFDGDRAGIDRLAQIAWYAYREARKAPPAAQVGLRT